MWAVGAAEGPSRSPGGGGWGGGGIGEAFYCGAQADPRRLDQRWLILVIGLTVSSPLCLQHELYIRAYHMLSDFPPVSLAFHFLFV